MVVLAISKAISKAIIMYLYMVGYPFYSIGDGNNVHTSLIKPGMILYSTLTIVIDISENIIRFVMVGYPFFMVVIM